MKIVITGATGFIGSALVKKLHASGYKPVLLSRRHRQTSAFQNAVSVSWNPENENEIVKEIDGADAVINLAGEPIVGKRWSKIQKMKILESRVRATRTVVHSIKQANEKPAVLINASAVGYYGSRGTEELTEESHPGSGFLTDVCKAWEAHAIRAEDFGVRVVRIRTGIALEKTGGALQKMLPPFRFGMGGWLGNGNQWMSWIHLEDLLRLILFCVENEKAKGAVNAISPQPVTNKVFSMVLAQVLNRPCLMPVPAFALKLLMGEMSEILLGSQRVLPKKARELGFSFQYPDIRKALEAALH